MVHGNMTIIAMMMLTIMPPMKMKVKLEMTKLMTKWMTMMMIMAI